MKIQGNLCGRLVAMTSVWLVLGVAAVAALPGPAVKITNIATDKARYAPGEPVKVDVAIAVDGNRPTSHAPNANVCMILQDLGQTRMTKQSSVRLEGGKTVHAELTFTPPAEDYHGYRLEMRLLDGHKKVLASAATAIDVSSTWTRFPRYGYVAHYDADIPAEQWISEMNRFHINGVQFYDFQYKHHLPRPPLELLHSIWPDIAKRAISANTLRSFLASAKKHNMMTMAYNASYAAYADAFHDGSGVDLKWAAWADAQGPRTEAAVKPLPLPDGWATPRLLYMNQNNPGWQNYIFSRMRDLFEVLPFDGWHIDTYGDPGAFAWDRRPIDYVGGLPQFANAARAALQRPVVLNTVRANGQIGMSRSDAEFVYSELWPEDHATYASIVDAADEVHTANPGKSLVFAAYLHGQLSEQLQQKPGTHVPFNLPAVLLADAVIFSSGASHIELGDGSRMLSNPYFPADTGITVSEGLRQQLRSYYDFQVAYENYLRDGAKAAAFRVTLANVAQTQRGDAGAVWTIAREKKSYAVVHLINLTGLKRTDWRDDALDYPPAPVLHNLRVQVQLPGGVESVGWASPDVDEGAWHELSLRKAGSPSANIYEVTIPELRYWTVLIFHRTSRMD